MVTGGLQRRIHRRHSAQSVAVLANRFVVTNVLRAWAIQPELAWPFASVDRFASWMPYRPAVTVDRFRLGCCVAERVQAAGTSTRRRRYSTATQIGARRSRAERYRRSPAISVAPTSFHRWTPTCRHCHRSPSTPAPTSCYCPTPRPWRRLAAADVPCDLHLWDGQIHDFPLAADVLPEGRAAIRYIGDFVKEVTGPASPGDAAAGADATARRAAARTGLPGALDPVQLCRQ